MPTHLASLLIAGLAIVLAWLGLGLFIGGLFYNSHRGDDEIGVADTQGRDADNR